MFFWLYFIPAFM